MIELHVSFKVTFLLRFTRVPEIQFITGLGFGGLTTFTYIFLDWESCLFLQDR